MLCFSLKQGHSPLLLSLPMAVSSAPRVRRKELPGRCGTRREFAAFRRGVAGRRLGQAGCLALAAIAGQKGNQLVHGWILGGVTDEATFLLATDQPDPTQVGKVERQGRRRQTQLLSDRTGDDLSGPASTSRRKMLSRDS